MALGDLPFPLSTEHGQPDQVLPFGDGGAPNDIASAYRAGQNIQGTPLGEPAKNVYTVSVYDSRPPNGVGVVIDRTLSFYDGESGQDSDPYLFISDESVQNDSIQDQWFRVARLTIDGGKIFVLKNVFFGAAIGESGIGVTKYRLVIDGTPVNGLDRIIINDSGFTPSDFNCFIPVGSNSVLELQQWVEGTYTPDIDTLWLTRFTGDMLLSQNVTLPWEPCNVE